MRNLKRVLSLALALVMVLGMMVITTSAATFGDADEITNKEAVEVLAEIGIVGGDGTGNFSPNGTFTREAAAKLLTYMLVGPTMAEKLAGTNVFTDVAANRWSAKYIAYCANLGYIGGVGNGKFNPTGVLTDIELGKLVLCALGYDASKYTGANWATAVTVDMIDAKLVDSVTGTAISREDACAMILAGMKKGNDVTTYNVKLDDGSIVKFDNQNDALLYCAIATGETYQGPVTVTTDSLLNKVYGVECKTGVDAYGRPATTYTDGKKLDLAFADAADYTITLTKDYTAKADTDEAKLEALDALVKDVIKATGVKNMNATNAINTGAVVVDGKAVAAGNAALFVAMADAAKAGTVLELYVADDGKTVEKIIAVCTYADTVKKVTEANAAKDIDASITLTGGLTYKTDAFAEDDVVIYTKAWNGTDAYEIQTIAKAKSVTGTLTSYTSKGEYTIDGTTYKLSSTPVSGYVAGDITAKYGKEWVYHLGADGKIVYGTAPDGAAPVVITDYAMITDTAVVAAKDAFGEVSEMTAQIKAILSDGTNGTYDLTIAKATSGANKGSYVYKIGNTETVVAADAKELTALENGIFTYTVEDGVITLAKKLTTFTGNEKADVVGIRSNSGEINKNSTTITNTSGATIIANSETIFVLKKGNGYEVKTGIAALESTKIDAWKGMVIVSSDYNEKTNSSVNVASVVFATGTTFGEAAGIVTTDSYIYIDGTYTVTMDSDNTPVYTYSGVKADGSVIAVTGDAGLNPGIYEYNTKNEIDTTNPNTNKVKVGTIAGTTVDLGGTYVTVNDTTKVVDIAADAALEKGAEVYYMAKDGVVTLIYVVKAAE